MGEVHGGTWRPLHLGWKTDILKVRMKYDKGSSSYRKNTEYTTKSVVQSLLKEGRRVDRRGRLAERSRLAGPTKVRLGGATDN